MFKKTLFTIFLACILAIPLTSMGNEDNLYRNDEYHFRIKFPAGWEIKDGDGEHVVKKAVKGGSSVGIVVKDMRDSEADKMLSEQELENLNLLEMKDFSDSEIIDLSKELISEYKEKFTGSKILEEGIRYLDNRKAYYFKISSPYKADNVEVEGITINYFTIHKGKFYHIFGGYGLKPIDESSNESSISASLSTFVFEDWSDPAGITGAENKLEDTETVESYYDLISENRWGALALILTASILFTWGFGLLIPFLFRFVILKHPLSQGASIGIAFTVWLIQLSVSVASGNNGKHLALVLVAFVSYRIMRSGSPEEELSKYCKKCGNKIYASEKICSKCNMILSENIQRPTKRWKEWLTAILVIILIPLLILFVALMFS